MAVFLTIILVVLLAPIQPTLAAPLLIPAAVPDVTLPASTSGFINQNITFGVSFSTTAATGYGPLIDIYLPATLGVGTNNAAFSATYLGTPIAASDIVIQTFSGVCGSGNTTVNHPFAVVLNPTTLTPDTITGPACDKVASIRLPFGSFTPGQPPASLQITTNIASSALVDGNPANDPVIRARAGFQFGDTAINDWCCVEGSNMNPSTPAISTWPKTMTVVPVVMQVSKTYNGPENETATGPNFPRQYTLSVDIANGQQIDTLVITDTLPNNILATAATPTPAATCVLSGGGTTPGGTVICTFSGSITGTAGSGEATVAVDFYVPLDDATPAKVLDLATGVPATSTDTVSASGNWTGATSPNTGGATTGVCVGCTHTLTDKAIAIQKSVANITDASNTPGDSMEYTLDFQVSDFFAFQNLVVTDDLSDGQDYDATFTPTLQIIEHGTTTNTPITPTVTVNPSGTTTLVFDLSAIGAAQPLVGGCIPTVLPGTGGAYPDCATFNGGATTGQVVFRTTTREKYRVINFPGDPDQSVDHGDTMTNTVDITGIVLDYTNLAATVNPRSDTSGASYTIAIGTLTKSIYAVYKSDGVTVATTPYSPTDLVTYRISYPMPSSDTESLTFKDYLPLPVFAATTLTTFDGAWDGSVPAVGHVKLGTNDTFHSLLGAPSPTISTSAADNSVTFTYGAYDLTTASPPSQIEILFTVAIKNDPFADQMYLTNQARASEGNSNGGTVNSDGIVQFVLGQPVLITKKSVVATSNVAAVFNPAAVAPAGITFNVPGTAGARWSGGNITSSNIGSTLNSNVTNMNGGDTVTFAILIRNTGSSAGGAFDIKLRDALNALYMIPGTVGAAPINLRIAYGDNTAVGFTGLGAACTGVWPGDPCGPDGTANTADDLFGTGIEVTDPGPTTGACQAAGHSTGHDIVIVTYDLRIKPGVAPNQLITNIETLFNYAGSEGGPDHTALDLTDQAQVRIGVAGTKTISPGIVTIGDTFHQDITVTIPPFTDAQQEIPVTGTVRLRDSIQDNGVHGDTSTATFTPISNCSGTNFDAAFIAATTLSIADTVAGEDIIWSFPAPIDNSTGSASCSFKVGIDLTVVDVDPGTLPAGTNRFWLPPTTTNATADDTATFLYSNGATNTSFTVGTAAANVDQPVIRLTKTSPFVLLSDGVTARTAGQELRRGDFIVYLLAVENVGEATAYEVNWTDTLPANLAYVSGSAFFDVNGDGIFNGTDVVQPDPTITGATATGQTLSFNYNADMPVGAANRIRIAFRTQVLNTMTLGTLIVNTADANWSTKDGSQPDERVYDDTAAISNDGGLDTSQTTHRLAGLTLAKSFTPPIVAVNGASNMTFTIANPNTQTPLTGIHFTDVLPAGLVIRSPFSLVNTCGGTVTAVAGGTSVDVSGVSLGTGTTCSVTLPVTSPTANIYDNTTSPISSTETGDGLPASATLMVADTLAVHKLFTPGLIAPGQTATIVFTLLNPLGVPLTAISFFDTLPLGSVGGGMIVATPANASNSGCGGIWNPQPNDTSLTFSGGTLAPGASCTLRVNVTGGGPNTFTNTTDPIRSAETGPTNRSNSAILTVSAPSAGPALQIEKRASAQTAAPGMPVTWTIVVTNSGSNVAAPVIVTDNVPPELVILNAQTSKGVLTQNGNAISVDVGQLISGEVVTITIQTNVADWVQPGTVVNAAFVGVASATASIDILPEELPGTGTGPLSWQASRWLLMVLAGIIAGLGLAKMLLPHIDKPSAGDSERG